MSVKNVNDLCDMVSFYTFCSGDNTVLLTSEYTDLWLPTGKVTPGNSWNLQILKEIKDVSRNLSSENTLNYRFFFRQIFGVEIKPERVLRLHKVWVPGHAKNFIYHCVFEIKCSADQKRKSKNTFGKVTLAQVYVNLRE